MLRLQKTSNKLVTFLNGYKDKVEKVQQSFKLPKRFEGTIVEKWKDYWINLFRDYVEVTKDTIATAKTEPRKSAAILSGFAFATYCFKTNPDEISYRDTVLNYSHELIFIGPTIRNPEAKKYLEEIENYYNQGVLSRLSLGIFSIMWKSDYSDTVGIYKAQCSHLKVPFYKFYTQIVDIGFLNKWHFLDKRMKDFDVNPNEWRTITSDK